MWLVHALSEQFADVEFEHEPYPARRELLLGNMRNYWGVGERLVRRQFLANRRRRWDRLANGQGHVEVNSMLCANIDLLGELGIPLRVVHQVRDPRTWTASMVRFKAAGFRRHLIDHVPFAIPYPVPRPAGWRSLSLVEKTLWRWRYCNEQILRIRPLCERYALIRYEDMFSTDAEVREQAMRLTLETLGLPAEDLGWLNVETRINPAPTSEKNQGLPDDELTSSICGELLGQMGYESR